MASCKDQTIEAWLGKIWLLAALGLLIKQKHSWWEYPVISKQLLLLAQPGQGAGFALVGARLSGQRRRFPRNSCLQIGSETFN